MFGGFDGAVACYYCPRYEPSWRIHWFDFRWAGIRRMEEVEYVEKVLPEVIRRAQRCQKVWKTL